MSYRAEKAGFAKEMQDAVKSKFDGEIAAKTLRWIRTMSPRTDVLGEIKEAGEAIPADCQAVSWDDYHGYLKSGLALGYLMASLDPAFYRTTAKKTWTKSNMAAFETARERERIGTFLTFVTQYGVPATCSFQNDQLYEQTDLTQVVVCLSQLGSVAQSKPDYPGAPNFWMQMHQENKREFTQQQLNAGQSVIGLQAGYNQGANASGVSFGGRRHINDMH